MPEPRNRSCERLHSVFVRLPLVCPLCLLDLCPEGTVHEGQQGRLSAPINPDFVIGGLHCNTCDVCQPASSCSICGLYCWLVTTARSWHNLLATADALQGSTAQIEHRRWLVRNKGLKQHACAGSLADTALKAALLIALLETPYIAA